MLECVYASREPVGILSWHPDRLVRNSVDGGQVIYLIDIEKVGVLKLPTFWFGRIHKGCLSCRLLGSRNITRTIFRKSIGCGIRQKLRCGEYYNKAQWGCVNNPKARNIELHPLQSKTIRRAFEEYACGGTLSQALRAADAVRNSE